MKKISKKEISKVLLTRKWAVLFELIIVFGLVLTFIGLFSHISASGGIGLQLWVFLANLLLLFLVWLSQKMRGESLKGLGFDWRPKNWKSLFRDMLWALVIFILAILFFQLGTAVIQLMDLKLQPSIDNTYEYLHENLAVFLVSLAGVYIVSSIGEELVYRGYLMHRILFLLQGVHFRNSITVFLSAIFFGLAHFQWGIVGIVQTTFVGVVFSSAFLILKKRLPALIWAHVFMDTLLFASIYFS